MSHNKFILLVLIPFLIIYFLLALYSYSQIDLNLTLSSNFIYQLFQKQMINLGYFNRPLSTIFYVLLLLSLYFLYGYSILLISHRYLSLKQVVTLIILGVVILFFSYPAFSHDIFNYLFDARIVTKYYANPYVHSALDYPNDLWIRFMHWTHRTYPYGPIWLLITLPFSHLGFGKFVLTLVNFKLMFILFHIGNIFLIYRILKKLTSPNNTLIGITYYSLNPLIAIESVLSPHNEVVMLFFFLLAVYLIISKIQYWLIIIILILSAGIKFITFSLLPIFLIYKKLINKWKINTFLWLSLTLLIPTLLIEFVSREPYSWYFIPFIGITSLLWQSDKIKIILISASLAAMLRYAPFIYRGEYSAQVIYMQNILFIIPIVLAIVWLLLVELAKKLDFRQAKGIFQR